MSRIFTLPRAVPIVSGAVSPGCKANFFLTGTTTPTNTFTDSALGTPSTNPVIANAAGEFATIYLDPDVVYKLTLDDTNDALIYTEDPIQDALTQANIGLIFYPRSAGEVSAGVTPTNFFEIYGNVKRYGADGGGSVDDTAALKAAIDVCEQDRTPVFLPAGVYLISSVLDLPTQFTMTGVGESKSRIKCNSATANVFTSTSTTLITIERLQIEFNVTRTAGAAMDFTSSTHGTVRDVRILAPFNAVNFLTCTNWKFENVLNTTGIGDNNRGWFINDSISMEFKNCINQWGTQFPSEAGFIVESNCDSIDFYNCQSIGGTSGDSLGFDIRHTFGGTPPRWIKLFGCKAEGGLSTDIANADIGYLVQDGTSIDFIGCYVTSSRDGLRITGGRGVRVIGGEYFQNGRHGINISGGSGHRVIGADIHNNSQETATTYDGITISGAVTDFQLLGNNIGTATNYGSISTHRHDILVTQNASDEYVITGNILKDGDTAELLDLGTGTNKIVKDNIIGSSSNKFELVTTTNVITAVENGKTFYLNAVGGFTSTLPAPEKDLKFTFIVKTAPTTAYIITTNAGANLLFGTFLDIVGELVYFSAQDTLNFVASTSLVGDRLEVESDGTNWYCKAFSGADGGITVSVT